MSDLKPAKMPRAVVPGLAYFTPDVAKPAKASVPPLRSEVAALDQMYSYFCD